MSIVQNASKHRQVQHPHSFVFRRYWVSWTLGKRSWQQQGVFVVLDRSSWTFPYLSKCDPSCIARDSSTTRWFIVIEWSGYIVHLNKRPGNAHVMLKRRRAKRVWLSRLTAPPGPQTSQVSKTNNNTIVILYNLLYSNNILYYII